MNVSWAVESSARILALSALPRRHRVSVCSQNRVNGGNTMCCCTHTLTQLPVSHPPSHYIFLSSPVIRSESLVVYAVRFLPACVGGIGNNPPTPQGPRRNDVAASYTLRVGLGLRLIRGRCARRSHGHAPPWCSGKTSGLLGRGPWPMGLA